MKVDCLNRTRAAVPTAAVRSDIRKIFSNTWLRRRCRTSSVPLIVTAVFVPADEARRLKRIYLGLDRPANVLSFHYGREAEIIVAPAVVRTEARASGAPYRRELRRMAVHGALHLLGCHHERSGIAADRFEAVERLLRSRLGLS